MKIKNQKIPACRQAGKIKILNFGLSFCILIFGLCILSMGCEAFVRKFTRKPKKEDLPRQELVLEPQEYKVVIASKEEQYRQYFLFWKSWHDELLNALTEELSHKKQLDCAQEAIKNLEQIKPLLNEPMQKKLDIYIGRFRDISDALKEDIYGSDAAANRLSLERLKRSILREFSYGKIREQLS